MPESLTPLLERIDRVVVLTLPEAQQRQAMVKHLLAGVGLPFEFHFGRDCRQSNLNDLIEAGDYDPLARRRAGRPARQGNSQRALRTGICGSRGGMGGQSRTAGRELAAPFR